MKITPLEIRQKTFEKNFRGYDKDEVDGYLLSLSQEWEKLQDENKELTIKLKSAEREVEKLREVENSLFKTLKTAEDTGANIMDQASKAAELHMKETELKAEALMNDARNKAHDTIEEAEMYAKETYSEMESQVKSMAKLYYTLENLRDDLLQDIKAVAGDITEKVNRAQSHVKHFDVDEQLREIRRTSVKGLSGKRKPVDIAPEEDAAQLPEKSEPEVKKEGAQAENDGQAHKDAPEETVEKPKKQDNTGGSFFDEID